MKNISKALAIISIAVALTLSFSPARAASLPWNIDAHISSTSAASASPTFFGWLCRPGKCD